MLRPTRVPYSDLLLDPNNPRLAMNFKNNATVIDEDVKKKQPDLEKLFGIAQEREPERALDRLIAEPMDGIVDDFFSIQDLKDSMRRIGFVGIQNIIVREIGDTQKYLVIEGNRRVAAVKAVIREHERALRKEDGQIDDEAKLRSLQTLPVMVLDTKGMDAAAADKLINTTLGLRHLGGQLKWDLLPRAKNIYDEYKKIAPLGFEYKPNSGKQVAEALAIGADDVRRLLRGYRCYVQLGTTCPVKPHHFSLILAAIENTHLSAYRYFDIDDKTYELLGDTAGKLDQLCEFGDRDRDGFPKTIRDPKEFKKLGSILRDANLHKSEAIRNYAQGLFSEVVQKITSLDDAYTDLVGFRKKHQWVEAIRTLLDKQAADANLGFDKFINAGSELRLKEELRGLLKKYLRVMEI